MRARQALVEALRPAMDGRGFSWAARKEWFRWRGGGVQDMLQVLAFAERSVVVVEPQLMVRHDQVETIFHTTSGYAPEHRRDTPTVGGTLFELVPGTPRRFTLRTDGDVAAAADRLLGTLGEIDAYWARFADLAEIDRDLNEEPLRPAPNRRLPWLRCSTGLIVARLVERPGYDELEAAYRDLLAVDNDGFYLGRFTALAEYLREHSPERLRSTRVR